ncbi:hypothetical protein BDN71DRAFT_1511325 [Pleurotus eryngii]|uniref:Uncharacterized protein n=1 Tax=Pleurotus eryngii TaxID=5323 RepID=A0A9P5ZPI2_PLEER|nr:hypothetical protein BDN71DRAFT_1511325 [Pleurotus eryngii]
MGEGDVDASLLWDWFNKAKQFFRHKSIETSARVEAIAWGMTGVHAVRWLSANSPLLPSMSWDDYKIHMRSLFLPTDWKHSTRMDILRVQQYSKSFLDFSLELMAKNNLLAGTDSFLNDDFLRNTLEANMDRELARELNRENTNSIVLFRDWLDEVKRINERRRLRLKEIEDTLARISLRNNSRPASTTGRPPVARATSASTMTASTASTFVSIPKLLPNEHALLTANGGCYKCRKFWAGHTSARCPGPPIDAATYKTLTAGSVPPRPTGYVSRFPSTPGAAVAAVISEVPADIPSANLIDITEEPCVPTVAAVLPNASS